MERASSSVSEIACERSSVVAIAHSNDLAVDLNKNSVSKGYARSKWCAYKTAVTEGRIDASVGIVRTKAKSDGPVSVSAVCPTATMSPFAWSARPKRVPGCYPGMCCHAPMNAKSVIERSVDLVAYQQETGNTIK